MGANKTRLLGSIYLKQNDHPIVSWPEQTIGNESPIRDDYLAAVKKADTGDMLDLIELHRQYLDKPSNEEA